jgi:hypothetical protein
MAKYKKGDILIYLGNMTYILGNDQRVNARGDILTLISDVYVQDNYFTLFVDTDKLYIEAMDLLHEGALAEEKEIEEKRKLALKKVEVKTKIK